MASRMAMAWEVDSQRQGQKQLVRRKGCPEADQPSLTVIPDTGFSHPRIHPPTLVFFQETLLRESLITNLTQERASLFLYSDMVPLVFC